MADGGGNIGRGKYGGGDLVEQRLEKMVILSVDQNNINWGIFEPFGSAESSESASDDNYSWPLLKVVGEQFHCDLSQANTQAEKLGTFLLDHVITGRGRLRLFELILFGSWEQKHDLNQKNKKAKDELVSN